MDKQKQITINSHPAYIWVGNQNTLIEKTNDALLQVFCSKNGCKSCINCKQILDRQHNNLLWLVPEKNYTIDQFDPIFKTISFLLEKNEHFFFVLQKADFFNATCANALLNILEEPPTGYHFILLAQRLEYILPTIRSRCLMSQFQSVTQDQETHQLALWFKNSELPDPTLFLQKIEKMNLNDHENLALLDELLVHWSKQYEIAHDNEKKLMKAESMIMLLKNSLEKPPMPGSSKIFWKNFYLQVPHI